MSGLSKPADTLIKKVSKAVGGYFAPYQIERLAKAEAKAAIIKAQTDIQITDLHRRAMHRFVEEEAQRQKNIEDITAKTLPQLNDTAKPSSMEDDWITNFFDKCRIISDEEMQNLWSRVLAGEANSPGTYSKRTVNFLSGLDKLDADLFSQLCGFGWVIGNVIPLVFDHHAVIYNRHDINFNTLSHLKGIGLIQFDSFAGFCKVDLPKQFNVYYYGKPLLLEMPKGTDNQIEIGTTLLTKIGQELAPICGSKPVDGFWDYVKNKWKKHLPQSETEPSAALNTGSAAVPPAALSSP